MPDIFEKISQMVQPPDFNKPLFSEPVGIGSLQYKLGAEFIKRTKNGDKFSTSSTTDNLIEMIKKRSPPSVEELGDYLLELTSNRFLLVNLKNPPKIKGHGSTFVYIGSNQFIRDPSTRKWVKNPDFKSE